MDYTDVVEGATLYFPVTATLNIPGLVNDEYLVSIGSQPEFHSSMDFGLRIANADMLRWLTSEYKLSAPEANLLIGTVVGHKIVTYFGTMAIVIPRRYLEHGNAASSPRVCY
jgi:hypothetical protein